MKKKIEVAVTGGAGQIAYQLLFRIAAGELFGKEQPLSLHILERSEMLPILEGVKMELLDCAFPLLSSIEISSDPRISFREADYAILIGAKPRSPGMERKDLLQENGKIFVEQGRAINEFANEQVKVFVIGNPCNTNCLIAMSQAPRIPRKNFYAMTRLDQNRATYFLAEKGGVAVHEVSHIAVWGNHSSTQVPDFTHAKLRGSPVEAFISDRHWLEDDFFSLVQKRGAVILETRGKSSAASAAQGILDAISDTLKETQKGHWFSSCVISSGNPYGIEDDLIFSFPCTMVQKQGVQIVSGLQLSDFIASKLKVTERELIEERESIKQFLK